MSTMERNDLWVNVDLPVGVMVAKIVTNLSSILLIKNAIKFDLFIN